MGEQERLGGGWAWVSPWARGRGRRPAHRRASLNAPFSPLPPPSSPRSSPYAVAGFGPAVGAHDGDWERWTARLDAESGELTGAWYNAHRPRDGCWLPAARLPLDGAGRPSVYVAKHGHGVYPTVSGNGGGSGWWSPEVGGDARQTNAHPPTPSPCSGRHPGPGLSHGQ